MPYCCNVSKSIAFVFLIVLVSETVIGDVIINEIMYNPGCTSDLCEWIELHNNESYEIDLSAWKIDDEDFDDINISGYGYAIVTRNLNNFTSYYGNFSFVADGSFSLSNSGDAVNLSSDNYSYFVGYEDVAREDYSLEYFNGSWYESRYMNGSMGMNNSIEAITDLDYFVIGIVEFLPDPFGDDNDSMPNGEWIELYNNGGIDLDLTGMYFYDAYNRKLIISDVTTTNNALIKANGFLVVYTNGMFGFLNNEDLEEIRLYNSNGELIEKISYGSSREGVSWSKYKDIWQMSEPSPGSENLDNKSVMKSSINIENVYDLGDDKAEWGDIIRVRLNVVKGDESKNNVKAWIEKDEVRVSKIVNANVEGKFLDYVLTLPIQIDHNENGKHKDGTYYIMAEGLNDNDRESIKIVSNKVVKKGVVYYMDVPSEIEGKEFLIDFNITNNDEDKTFEVWSYVYRGSKSYSGDRQSNLKKIRLNEGESINLKLNNEVDAKEGDYKVKINVKESDKKTVKDFTQSIRIVENFEDSDVDIESNLKDASLIGNVVYESKDERNKRNAIFFFCLLLILVLIALVKNDS